MLKSLTLTYIPRFEYHFLNYMFHKPAKQASEGAGKGNRRERAMLGSIILTFLPFYGLPLTQATCFIAVNKFDWTKIRNKVQLANITY